MKKHGILNREIASILARLGHTDTIMIADCGLPIPEETRCIDVSLNLGTPDLITVLRAVTGDMKIERATLAEEIQTNNPTVHQQVSDCLADIPKHYTTHENLKKHSKDSKVIIRTGEATPFSNVLLQSGVIFS